MSRTLRIIVALEQREEGAALAEAPNDIRAEASALMRMLSDRIVPMPVEHEGREILLARVASM
ncbi:MAG: hypothetical protein EOR30_31195 [Mesorhizobium sp.]|uniref:hypothetical protein n=1 Tax=Mesorhizobium sp. TaxID=1871066 RepID=UPI000FEA1841|nr:hypothetical protein [Mesorhizobium sp.]RWI63645.1 MAG: hypothetical protein EOR17_28185 [Mesorhizobium sp.]RWJ42711.1 MAG: hypothetical protein EOR30_31195 [Mesorhizobium sp.]RWJ58116.1 MAG: hypothetical protein EOR32_26390 [Mesorhizobium sp.]RWJ63980.1 MAG: hypothetical protein EOR34_31940 [Mesorhizobium sp.]RWJ93857.1 MAG: hypothetical protein EOR38_30720 [Mesorhizobium sp.]